MTALRGFLDPSRLLLALGAVVVGGLTIYFAFNDGGYLPAAVALVAVELALLVAVRFLSARVPWEGFGVALAAAVVGLGFLAAWTLASSGWSHSPIRAMTEYNRVLVYLLVLVFFGSFRFSVQRVRWMLYGFATAIVVVSAAAFAARALPNVLEYEPSLHPQRLGFPLSYWNALGLLAAIGIVLCTHLASSLRDPWPVRALGAASVPLLTTVLVYTLSRGATYVAVGAVVVYVIVGRPRGLLTGAIAIAPATALALAAAIPTEALTTRPIGASEIAAGHTMALTMALAMFLAAALRTLLLPLDRRLDRLVLARRSRGPLLAASAAATVAVLAICVAFQVPEAVGDRYTEFTSGSTGIDNGEGAARLGEAGSNGRVELWKVAKASYETSPIHGTGAGTWALEWTKRRPYEGVAQDAHSLYFEMLGELGLPGLLAIGGVVLLILGAFLTRVRGPDRAIFAALFAAGLAWAVHAGIDWDWEMPAVGLWFFAFGGAVLAVNRTNSSPRPAVAWPVKAAVVAACAVVAIIPLRVALSEDRIDSSLDALGQGDCQAATSHARDALSVLERRPLPHQVIGFCALTRGKPGMSAREMARAIRWDPSNWELHYNLAIARALAGRDPRPEARRALRLSPREKPAQRANEGFQTGGRARWARVASNAGLLAPGRPTP